MDLRASVIVPVYNAVRALELVLTGYTRQSCRDFELVIADDGSGPEVRALVHSFSHSAPFPIRYVYHADEGYRKTQILNRAVLASSSSYLIFADADCVPHVEFVKAHCDHIGARTVLCGRRVNLSRELSESLRPKDVFAGFTAGMLLRLAFVRGTHWDEAFLVRSRTLRRWINNKKPTILGCNFSLEKQLFEEINGYNEDFAGYAGEDTDLEFRLRLAGARFQWVRHLAIQYHLYHPARTRSESNVAALERTRAEGRPACRNGLRKL